MLNTILYVDDKRDMPVLFTTICFITRLINKYIDRLPPLIRQFLLTPDRIYRFVDLRANISTPALINSAWF